MENEAVSGIMLTLLLVTVFIVNTAGTTEPVGAYYLPTVIYVEPAMYDGTNVPVGTIFDVTVYIEKAVDMVGWSLSVKVDPTILEVVGLRNPLGRNYIIDAYYATLPLPTFWPPPVFDPGTVNKTGGTIIDASHMISGWPDLLDLGIGGFDGSIDPITMGKAKLCMIAFKTKVQTGYSPIDLFDVKLFDTSHTPDPHYSTEPDITVIDGSYQKLYQPPAAPDLCVDAVVFPSLFVPLTIIRPPGWGVDVNVTNQGSADAGRFNVSFTLHFDGAIRIRDKITVESLQQGANKTLLFSFTPWDYGNYGNYTLTITADCDNDIVELNETNNTRIKCVFGAFPGDLDLDGFVGPIDLSYFAAAYGKHWGQAGYNILADFDGDGYIGPIDLSIFAGVYHKLVQYH